ncbi:hypothetical protein DPMN_094470 [Dreissena polymorpha]|uniref:Uncharacterized protein n=1 Tax=Dreissena polymorpha TaxID=45954 RepID=A0A9D4L7P8_DREPO|nr:hypothetical protein DPMN_094470 [Dreissena polymorpha]
MKTAATLFHEDWAPRVLTSKAALPPGSHIFQQTETNFKLSLAIIKTNVQTKFHEDWTINVNPRVFTSKTALPPGGHVFLLILTIFKLNRRIEEISVLTKFHEDWTKNVASRAFTCFYYIHIEKTAPPPGGHVFSPTWTIFEPVRDINETNVLTKNTAAPPGGHVFQWTGTIFELNQHIIKTNILTNFELGRGIIGTNVLTKFHEDQTINVVSRVFTRQMLTTDGRRTKAITIAQHEHVVLR